MISGDGRAGAAGCCSARGVCGARSAFEFPSSLSPPAARNTGRRQFPFLSSLVSSSPPNVELAVGDLLPSIAREDSAIGLIRSYCRSRLGYRCERVWGSSGVPVDAENDLLANCDARHLPVPKHWAPLPALQPMCGAHQYFHVSATCLSAE